ncbi:LAQU0S04e08988g1_1 [Lachancea quebecensis]|uniref:LAQU0S04e08988g1_1 n=1 Tax=Lachancea quebecensis TaxID=1654605 RepID=A0A0P1KY70_9SACH|nr:LAQU0S04e08988g1_1 [Lachancea quebecensis]
MNVPRVYTLGNAPLTYLVCHEIASLSIQPRVPELVLLLQDQRKLNRFLENESKIYIKRRDNSRDSSKQYMASCSPPKYASGEIATIDNLIIGETRPPTFVNALKKYSECIHNETNVLLLNPGFGVREQLEQSVWEQKGFVPNIFMGLADLENSFLPSEFTMQYSRVHQPLKICRVPKGPVGYDYQQDKHDAQTLESTNNMLGLLKMLDRESTFSNIGVATRPYGDLLLCRYEELVIQSCIKPLSALFPEKGISESTTVLGIVQTLVREFTRIIKATDPYLQHIPHSEKIINEERLFAVVLKKLKKRSRSLLNQPTIRDINQYNGYFVMKSKASGLWCQSNYFIMKCAKAKLELQQKNATDFRYL